MSRILATGARQPRSKLNTVVPTSPVGVDLERAPPPSAGRPGSRRASSGRRRRRKLEVRAPARPLTRMSIVSGCLIRSVSRNVPVVQPYATSRPVSCRRCRRSPAGPLVRGGSAAAGRASRATSPAWVRPCCSTPPRRLAGELDPGRGDRVLRPASPRGRRDEPCRPAAPRPASAAAAPAPRRARGRRRGRSRSFQKSVSQTPFHDGSPS